MEMGISLNILVIISGEQANGNIRAVQINGDVSKYICVNKINGTQEKTAQSLNSTKFTLIKEMQQIHPSAATKTCHLQVWLLPFHR